jgi:hypothetical protein
MGTLLSRLVFIGLSICTFTGCATLIFDRYDKVDIVTQPTGVEIYDSEGFNIGITPVQIPFKRLPRQHLTLRKDGYVDTTVVMSTSINPWGTALFLVEAKEITNMSPSPTIYGTFLVAEALFIIVSDFVLGGVFKKNDTPYIVRMKKRSTSSTLTSIDTNHSGH